VPNQNFGDQDLDLHALGVDPCYFSQDQKRAVLFTYFAALVESMRPPELLLLEASLNTRYPPCSMRARLLAVVRAELKSQRGKELGTMSKV